MSLSTDSSAEHASHLSLFVLQARNKGGIINKCQLLSNQKMKVMIITAFFRSDKSLRFIASIYIKQGLTLYKEGGAELFFLFFSVKVSAIFIKNMSL